MEVILSTAFGRVIELQKGQSSQLTEAATTIFCGVQEHKKTSLVYGNVILSKRGCGE